MKKKGSLVCVGSGIRSVGHLTVEARGWIEHADIVIYCVADPATEVWIKKHSRKSLDLYTLYGNDKKRIETYNGMVDTMLAHLRDGKDVCAVFYGHPGVFVNPTHRAIEIARAEGYAAAMLPAVSALDCLFADVGIDPSRNGCQEVEATDLLLRERPLLSDGHVVIWQIGCVGDVGFRFAGYDNRNLGFLVDYLRRFYSARQEVVHYQGAQFPMCDSRVDRLALQDLRDAPVTGISTLYVPPVTERPLNAGMVQRLGLGPKAAAPVGRRPGVGKAYREVPLKSYAPTPPESGLADLIADLAADPGLLADFARNPQFITRLYPSMTDREREAAIKRHPGMIRTAIKEAGRPELAVLDRLYPPEDMSA